MMERGVIRGIRRGAVGRHEMIPAFDAFEMRVQTLRVQKPMQGSRVEVKPPMEESARAAGVNDELRRNPHRLLPLRHGFDGFETRRHIPHANDADA